jgi:hypothetical protein
MGFTSFSCKEPTCRNYDPRAFPSSGDVEVWLWEEVSYDLTSWQVPVEVVASGPTNKAAVNILTWINNQVDPNMDMDDRLDQVYDGPPKVATFWWSDRPKFLLMTWGDGSEHLGKEFEKKVQAGLDYSDGHEVAHTVLQIISSKVTPFKPKLP